MLLVDELRDAWREETRDHRVALVVICVIGAALRLAHLAQPMRYDEAVTYLYFVKRPITESLSVYTYPNNHLFHTLLAKVAVELFGGAPWVLRLPALVAGILVVPASYAVTRQLYDGRAALVATAIVAYSGTLTLYSTNARGYSILVLAFLLLVLVGARLLRHGSAAGWVAFAVIAALGLWTVPVMLFPLGAVALWLALCLLVEQRRGDLRRLAATLAASGMLAAIGYAPVIAREGLGAITRNRFVVSSGWFDFFEQLPGTVREALVSWSLGVPPLLSLVLALCAIVALRRHATLSRFRVGLPLAAFVWCAWLLVVNHRAPFPRVWLWLYPVAAALAAAGVCDILARRPAESAAQLLARIPVAAGVLAIAAALSVYFSRSVLITRDTGIYLDARRAADLLAPFLQTGDRVVAPIPSNAPLAYYFDRAGVAQTYLSLDEQRAKRVIVVVNRAEGHTLERILPQTRIGDLRQFSASVLARLPSSELVLLQRRDAAPK